jgi:catechol 2,3-dioxygenase-like lactoylglutathione lyase family enzyme
MLKDTPAVATVPVRDMGKARRFYEGTLGLSAVHNEGEQAVSYGTGPATLLVYVSQFAGGNQATAVSWMVDDIEAEVRALKDKGVAFEHYDLPQTRRVGDVHDSGYVKNAWFKDPDGNIHALVSAQEYSARRVDRDPAGSSYQ